MSRRFIIVMGLFAFGLLMVVGYLSAEVSQLEALYQNTLAQTQTQQKHSMELAQIVDSVQTQVQTHHQQLNEAQIALSGLNTTVADLKNQPFLLSPELTPQPIFTTKTTKPDLVRAEGDVYLLQNWLTQNELFIEQIGQKALKLEFDPARGVPFVKSVLPNSIYAQMGLLTGDRVLSIDGKTLSKGADIRAALMTVQNKKIWVWRQGKPLTIAVDYVLNPQEHHALNMPRKNFDEALELLKPALDVKGLKHDGRDIATQIASLKSETLLGKLTLQTNDIITKINGQVATPSKLIDQLKFSVKDVTIDYLRDNKPRQIKLTLTDEIAN